MNAFEIKSMRTPRERLHFIKFPWKIYRNDPMWVPPLISERKKFLDPSVNPYFKHADVELFGALRSGELVGTIAANVNHAHNNFHNDKVGFFGFFECMNDPDIAAALFDAAGVLLRQKGMEVMRGPMNFSTNGECGLLIEGFDSSSVFFMPYNFPYYQTLIEGYGFSKTMDVNTFSIPEHGPPDFLVQLAEDVAKNADIRIRNADMKRYDTEVEHIKRIYNRAWRKNWGFVPITDDELAYMAKLLRPLVDPEVCFIAEVRGEPVGFAVPLPDYNIALRHMNGHLFPFGWLKFLWYKRKIDVLLGFFMGILPEYQYLQIGALIYLEAWKAALEKGYKSIKSSWVLENNKPMNRALQWVGAKIYKTYRVYDKRL